MVDPEKTIPPVNNLPADAPWWARWMVAEWRDFYKWLNSYFIGAMIALPSAYEVLPKQYQDMIPVSAMHWLQALLGLATFVNLMKKKGSQ